MTLCVMCTLYAGIYRVALRLQRAAEARRSRMAASIVSAASQAITNIGFGMSRGSVPQQPAPAARLPGRADSSSGPTAVAAELHSNNDGKDRLKATSPDQSESFTTRRTSNVDDEHNMEVRGDYDNETATVALRTDTSTDHAKQQTEVTPLLEQPDDRERPVSFNNNDVASTSCVDGSQFPVTGMTSKCRRRWLVVLPSDDDEAVEPWANERMPVRHSVDVGRPRFGIRSRSSRRSLFEMPNYAEISTVATLPDPPAESWSSDESVGDPPQQNDRTEIFCELANAVNDVIDVVTAVEHHCTQSSRPRERPQSQSVGCDRLSAEKKQLTIEATTTTTSPVVEKCDDRAADRCCSRQIVSAARQQQPQQPKKNEDRAEKNDDVVGAEKTVKGMADRWRRTARSQFTAKRRFAHLRHWTHWTHLRHWKLQRRTAAQSPTSSSIDSRQIPVSRPLLLSSLSGDILVTKMFL